MGITPAQQRRCFYELMARSIRCDARGSAIERVVGKRLAVAAAVGESSCKAVGAGGGDGVVAARISASAKGCAGIRRPTVGNPAVTMSGTSGRSGLPVLRDQQRRARTSAALGQWEARPRAIRWSRHGR